MDEKLRNLLELLRAYGVTEYSGDGISLKLDPGWQDTRPLAPTPAVDMSEEEQLRLEEKRLRRAEGSLDEEETEDFGMSIDEIMNWSAGGR